MTRCRYRRKRMPSIIPFLNGQGKTFFRHIDMKISISDLSEARCVRCVATAPSPSVFGVIVEQKGSKRQTRQKRFCRPRVSLFPRRLSPVAPAILTRAEHSEFRSCQCRPSSQVNSPCVVTCTLNALAGLSHLGCTSRHLVRSPRRTEGSLIGSAAKRLLASRRQLEVVHPVLDAASRQTLEAEPVDGTESLVQGIVFEDLRLRLAR